MERLPLVFVGGGGHCKSVIDAAESAGWRILGIIDRPESVGSALLGYPVIGCDADIASYVRRARFVITVGQIRDCNTRQALVRAVEAAGGRFATVVASDARVSPHAELGEGSVVLHKACINAGAAVGRHCIVNTMANIEHDARIGDFCHLSTGAAVNGGSRVGARCFVGSGAILYHGISVADDTVIPAGAIVRGSL